MIEEINILQNTFNQIVQHDFEANVEFWYARDLQTLLGYKEWRNFETAIDRAKQSCETSGFQCTDHFVEINKTIQLPKGATREISDYKLTRYACYLIAQNGDPKKREIAFAQCYFAVQTRRIWQNQKSRGYGSLRKKYQANENTP